ncbi:phage lysin [alpha proteobacterium U9-1i]|nr:phage lysin [alpha proteobacterium U9-1i]
MPRHAISNTGLALVREHEGFRAEPAQLPDGNWVVGHGHVRAGEPGDSVSEEQASALLALDVAEVEELVSEKLTADVSQSQFDALVSFAFSVGADAFAKSDVLRHTNKGDIVAAACAMDAWRKGDVQGELEIVGALVRRRAAEKALYLQDCAREPAPSALLRAKIDHAAAILGAPSKRVAAAAGPRAAIITDKPKRKAKPKPSDAEIITAVLKSEPATAALLLTRVATEEEIAEADEIVTAHAKPVARVVEASVQAESFRMEFTKPADVIGLGALSLFGLGLVGLGCWTMFSTPADAVDLMAGMALAIPGIAALTLAGLGFARRPVAQRA